MEERPAIRMTVASGVMRQTCTKMTEALASSGLPSQTRLLAGPKTVPGPSKSIWRRM